MKVKNVRSILQDILLGIRPIMLAVVMLFSMSFSNQKAVAGDYFTRATINTLVTFHIDNTSKIDETVLSEILQIL